MYLSKYSYIINSGNQHIECKCEICKQKPAVMMMADCGGDCISLCRKHWEDYFQSYIIKQFDVDEDMKEVEQGIFIQRKI